jgi:hypothetical protein
MLVELSLAGAEIGNRRLDLAPGGKVGGIALKL